MAAPAAPDLLLKGKVKSMNKSKTAGGGILLKPLPPKDEGRGYRIESKTISLDVSQANPLRATEPSAERWQRNLCKEVE